MADRGADLAVLPKEVKDQLAELELELSEVGCLRGLSNTVTQLAPVGVWVMVRGSVLSHLREKKQPWQL
ncbi:disco-interacting protein 2 homolog B-A isoform X1 [Tachysurus ichikawai]